MRACASRRASWSSACACRRVPHTLARHSQLSASAAFTRVAALLCCGEPLHTASLQQAVSLAHTRLRLFATTQEFLELVRQQQPTRALLYARKHFMPFAEAHFPEMRRAVTALAFGADTTCARYAELFDPSRWDLLAELFQQDLFRMHSLTPRSLLDLHLQVALCLQTVSQTHVSYAAGCV